MYAYKFGLPPPLLPSSPAPRLTSSSSSSSSSSMSPVRLGLSSGRVGEGWVGIMKMAEWPGVCVRVCGCVRGACEGRRKFVYTGGCV